MQRLTPDMLCICLVDDSWLVQHVRSYTSCQILAHQERSLLAGFRNSVLIGLLLHGARTFDKGCDGAALH